MVVLEQNTIIYMGEDMINSLANPIQCEDNNMRIDLRQKLYYLNNKNPQSITFPDGTSIPVE